MENEKEREEIIELTEVVKDGGLKGKKGKAVIIIIGIILAAFALGYWAWWSIETAKQVKEIDNQVQKIKELAKQVKDAQAKLNEIKAELEEIKEALASEPEKVAAATALELATVEKSEGIEHALIKQLINDPFAYGFEGDATSGNVKKWAQKKAHQIATLAGYYDWKFGREVRVKKPDFVAYLLAVDSNGKIQVEQYTKDENGNFKTEPESIQELAKDYAFAKFKGDKQGGIQQYEYLFIGG